MTWPHLHQPAHTPIDMAAADLHNLYQLITRLSVDSPDTAVTVEQRHALGELRRQLHQRGLA